jgi:hypothetical protein
MVEVEVVEVEQSSQVFHHMLGVRLEGVAEQEIVPP